MHGQEQRVRDDGQQEQTGAKYGRAAGCLRKTPGRLFSSLLFSSLLILCSLGFTACNGNGGSHDSGGATYVPGGGSGSGSSGSSGSATGSSSTDTDTGAISAEELRRLANGGWADSITALFPTGEDETTKTFFLNLPAEDFGVPEDGTMQIIIDSDGFANGETHWDSGPLTAIDGCFHFMNIPVMQVGSRVTVTVLCYTRDGILVTSGSGSGIVKDNMNVPMEIAIIGSARIVFGSNSAPNGNTTERGGVSYDIIEYAGTGLQMAAVNPNKGAVMNVTVNGTLISTTTESSVTAPLSDGYNTIEVTVTKGDNTPVVTTRNIYVVRQFSTPVIALGSNGSPNGKTASIGGVDYEVIEYTGAGLGVTVTNGFEGTATFDVQVNGSSISGTPVTGSATSVTATLADGANAIVATLTESVNGSVQAEKYVYVVKQLVAPVITMSGATANGETVTSGGKSYQVIEYTGTNPTVTITNSYDGSTASYEAKLGTTVLSTACPSTITGQALSDGFNAVTATLSEPYCDTLKDEKYYYVVKALTEDDVSFAFSDYSTASLADDGTQVLYFSYLADPLTMPNLSIDNDYTGDATTSELGDSYLEITISGDTTVAQTSSLSNQELNLGGCSITVNLCKPKCTTVPIVKNINIKIKPVTVSFSSLKLDYDGEDHDKFIHQTAYIQAVNADGTDPLQKTAYEKNGEQFSSANTEVGVWSHKDDEVPVSATAVLTAPDSTFKFWTTVGYLSYDHNPGVGNTSVGSYSGTWTLDELKTQTWPISPYVGSAGAASRYTFTLTVSDD